MALLQGALERLGLSFSDKAEKAYDDRDHAADDNAQAYAAGEAHAYGIAEAEIRREDRPPAAGTEA